jgi:hypothetical protein
VAKGSSGDPELRATIAAEAAERYRLDHGRWPTRLDELVPVYLTAVPADPYADGPVKLRRFDNGPYIYSIGPDRLDQGGQIDWEYRWRDTADRGIRLWDVDRRRQAPPTDDHR